MTHKFQVGDTVRPIQGRLEIEIVGQHPEHDSMVLCAWFDEDGEWQELYYRDVDLVLVKAAVPA